MVHESRTRWNPAIAAMKRNQRGAKPKLDLSSYAIDDDIDFGFSKSKEAVVAEGAAVMKKEPRVRKKKTAPPPRFKSYAGPAPSVSLTCSQEVASSTDGAKCLDTPATSDKKKLLVRSSSDRSKKRGSGNTFSRASSFSGGAFVNSDEQDKSTLPDSSPGPTISKTKPKPKKNLLPPSSKSPRLSPSSSPKNQSSASSPTSSSTSTRDHENKAVSASQELTSNTVDTNETTATDVSQEVPSSGTPSYERKLLNNIVLGDAAKTGKLKQTKRVSAIECAAASQLRTTKKNMKASAMAAAEASQLRTTKKNLKASALAAAEACQMRTTKRNIKASALAAANRSRLLSEKKSVSDTAADPAQIAIDKAKENLDPAIRAKIDKIFDPSTPVRERISTEIHLKKDKKLATLITELKYLNGRKMKVQQRKEKVQSDERQKIENLEKEANRAAQEKARIEQKRLVMEQAADEAKQRQAHFDKNLRVQVAKTIVDDYERIRQDAEEAKRIADIKREEKKRIAKERREYIQSELAGEQNDVMRNLKEAWMESLMDEHDTSL